MSLVLVIAFTNFILISTSEWLQSPTSNMPRSDYCQAVGTYNRSIFLLGGYQNYMQLIQYDIDDDTFTDHGSSAIPTTFGYSQYYTQIGNILYISDPHTNAAISMFDMKTRTFTSYVDNVPTNPDIYACLASTSNYLFLLGGGTQSGAINTVQIYDMFINEWLIDAPPMNDERGEFSCIVHPTTNMLYVFGGSSRTLRLSSIETIDTDTIMQSAWVYMDDELSQGLSSTRCIIYEEMIFVIGGTYTDGSSYVCVDTVYTVNTLTNQVSLSTDTMPLPLSDVAPVIVDNVVYAFGGFDANSGWFTWMMYTLVTASPNTESPVPTVQTTADAATHHTTISEHITSTTATTESLSSEINTFIPDLTNRNTPSKRPSNKPSTSTFYSPSTHLIINSNSALTTMIDPTSYKSTENMYTHPSSDKYSIFFIVMISIIIVVSGIILLILTVWLFLCIQRRINAKTSLAKNIEMVQVEEKHQDKVQGVNNRNDDIDNDNNGNNLLLDFAVTKGVIIKLPTVNRTKGQQNDIDINNEESEGDGSIDSMFDVVNETEGADVHIDGELDTQTVNNETK